MHNRLAHLKARGFNPRCILDIGANVGEWSDMIKGIWPQADLFLFEADKVNTDILNKKGYKYFIALLGDEEKNVDFFCCPSARFQTGNSIFKEKTHHYTGDRLEIRTVQMKTLDTIVSNNEINNVDFIKLDIQGAELLALEGGKNTLSKAEVVLLEVALLEYNEGAPMLSEVVSYMDNAGFQAYDVVELHYLPNKLLSQLDVLFVRKTSPLLPTGLLC